MMELPKIFILIGIFFIIAGGLYYVFEYFGGSFLGNLPGDIKIEKENFKFYFPLASSILISIIISILVYILNLILLKIK